MITKQGYDIRVGTPEELEDKFIILISAWYEGILDDEEIEYVDITAPERPVIKKIALIDWNIKKDFTLPVLNCNT